MTLKELRPFVKISGKSRTFSQNVFLGVEWGVGGVGVVINGSPCEKNKNIAKAR